jgi:hypothetical protein
VFFYDGDFAIFGKGFTVFMSNIRELFQWKGGLWDRIGKNAKWSFEQ